MASVVSSTPDRTVQVQGPGQGHFVVFLSNALLITLTVPLSN